MLTGLTLRDILFTLAISAGVLLGLWFVLWLAGRLVRRFADRLEETHRAPIVEIERWAQQFIHQVLRPEADGQAGDAGAGEDAMRIKTVPRQQWVVGRELRRRIKKTFDERGIEIPYPHVSVYFDEAGKPVAVQLADDAPREAPTAAPGRRPGD